MEGTVLHLHRPRCRHTAIHRTLGSIIIQAHRLSSVTLILILVLHPIIHIPLDVTFANEAGIIARRRSQLFLLPALSDHPLLALRS